VNRDPRYAAIYDDLVASLNLLGVSSRTDESGVAIGKKYARHDELGIPFAVTLDPSTFDDGAVTLRERDSCHQVRVPLAMVAEEVQKLCSNAKKWTDVQAIYPAVSNAAEGAVGSGPKAAAPAATSKQADVEAYLAKHNLRELLQACVSDVCAEQAADPIAALTKALQSRK